MIANFVLFQLGWFACVLSAAHHVPWLGVATVAASTAFHMATRGQRQELLLVTASASLGLLIDSIFLHTGLVTYRSLTTPEWLAPAWIVAMWANFALTLRHSLGWLSGRPWLAAGLGAVFGPLAYWGAAGLGAANLATPRLATIVLALVWAAAVPLLVGASRHVRGE